MRSQTSTRHKQLLDVSGQMMRRRFGRGGSVGCKRSKCNIPLHIIVSSGIIDECVCVCEEKGLVDRLAIGERREEREGGLATAE